MQLLERIWRDGYSYSKGRVMLSDFWDVDSYQPGLFDTPINRRGLGRIQLASEGLGNAGVI